MPEQSSFTDGLPMPQRIGAVVTVLLCLAMAAINISLVNIALPMIAQSLKVAPEEVLYIVSIYQLVMVLFLLFVATLGDYFGYKQVVLVGIVLFTIASLGCAFSRSFIALIICRIVQGLGATAIQGSYLFLMTRIYPKQQLGRGMGLSSVVFAVVSIMGPAAAALILSFATWHWLFLINVPFGVAGFFLGWYYLPANAVKTKKCSISVSDTVLHILTFGLFFGAASNFSHHPQQIAVNVSLFAGLIIIAVSYIFIQSKKALPFFPVDLFRQMSFSFAMIRFVLYFAALMSVVVAFPFILHSRFGYSPTHVGLLLVALAVATIVASLFTGYCIEKVKPIYLCGIGFAVLLLGALGLTTLPDNASVFDIVWRLAICGIGCGLSQPANNVLAMNAATPARKGAAGGMIAMVMIFGQIVGLVTVTAIFCFTDNEKTLLPFGISGFIAAIGVGVVCVELAMKNQQKNLDSEQ